MEASFWHQKWQNGDIAFHLSEANPLLVAHFDKLNLKPGSRILVPLCGKTRDIAWLLTEGYRVAGAELSEIAIQELFRELGVVPQISAVGNLLHYSATNVDIWVGDIFELAAAQLGPVDGIYDRAALVAMHPDMRSRYAAHLKDLSNAGTQLLITYDYDQMRMAGPPFSVNSEEISRLYGTTYQIERVARMDVEGGVKGLKDVVETVWLLKETQLS